MFMLLALRVPLLGQILLTRLVASVPWTFMLKAEYLIANWTPVLFVVATHFFYPRSIPRPFLRGFLLFVLANTFVIVAGSVLLYSRIILYVLLPIVGALSFVVVHLVLLLLRGRKELLPIIAGLSIFALIIVGEIAHYREWILSRDLDPLGFLGGLLPVGSVNPSAFHTVTTLITFGLISTINTLIILGLSRTVIPGTDSEPPLSLDAFNLTRRETEIVKLVIRGASNKEIAAALFISEGTVKVHLHNIMVKMDVRNRTELTHRIVHGS